MYSERKHEVWFYEPKYEVGTVFTYKRGKQSTQATIVGYHMEYNSDLNKVDTTYRISYNFAGLQDMVATVARSTVDMAIGKN